MIKYIVSFKCKNRRISDNIKFDDFYEAVSFASNKSDNKTYDLHIMQYDASTDQNTSECIVSFRNIQ
jgi:hypothetical protein